MNYDDIEKIRKQFEGYVGDKTLIITTKDQVSFYTGDCVELEKYKIYILDRSKEASVIKNEDFSEKVKPKVIATAKLTIEKTLIELFNELKKLYPSRNINIFVWYAGNVIHSGWTKYGAYAKFKESENSAYGHDVLIILN